MTVARDLPAPSGAPEAPPLGEQRIVIPGASWDDYVRMNDTLGSLAVRMWYSDGELEIMVTSPLHERLKTTIARLVELYAFDQDVVLNGYGSATFRAHATAKGAEPDECYVVGATLSEGGVPDIVLEVVLTSGGIDKLEVYRGLGVREVWFFESGAFHLHELTDSDYQAVEASRLVPGLDLDAVARFAQLEDQHEALKALRSWLRGES